MLKSAAPSADPNRSSALAEAIDPRAVLRPQLISHRRQTACRAGKHVHGSTVARRILERHADGEVVEPIAVHVLCRQSSTEAIVRLGVAVHIGVGLRPELVLGRHSLKTARRTEQDDHASRTPQVEHDVPRDANGQIVESVGVEVTDRQGPTEMLVRAWVSFDHGPALIPELIPSGCEPADEP